MARFADEAWRLPDTGGYQSVAYTGTAGTISNAISDGVNNAYIWVSSVAHIAVGAAPTATTSYPAIPANTLVMIKVNPGEKVSAIQASTGGTLYVLELSR